MTLPSGVLLAAGSGTRFGSHKLMHPLPDGQPIGLAAARNLIEVVPHCIGVVRPGDKELIIALLELGYQVVENTKPGAGMGDSLALAVQTATNSQGWLVALGDMPWIRQLTIRTLARRIERGASLVAPTYSGRRGHPVGFASRWGCRLANISGDQGARIILGNHRDELELLPVDDPGVLFDVDRPEQASNPDFSPGGDESS